MPPAALCAQNCANIRGCTPNIERLLRPCSARANLWPGNRRVSSDKRRNFARAASSHQEPSKAAESLPSSRATPARPSAYSIRRATPDDVGQVGELNAEAFAWLASKDMRPGLLKQYTEQAEVFYQQSIYQDSVSQLKRALNDKQQASRGAREATFRRQSRKLRADIARLQGQPIPALPLEDRLQRVAGQSWRRKRQFMCLVAEERSSKRLVASCVLSLAAPDALLPAPFPTTKPWRLYCSNMAVATAHRRQGLATALLHHCQRVGAFWGHKEVWLHVDIINQQAQSLYLGSGFDIRSQDSWYYILSRKRYLMQKALPERQGRARAQSEKQDVAGGSVRGSDGVYVWDVQSDSDSSTSAMQTSSSDADT